MQALEQQIQALVAALIGLAVFQIQSYLRSRKNRQRIEAVKKQAEANDEEAREHRAKVEQDTQALVNRFAQESLDRIDRLLATLDRERDEHKIERGEWREDRDEWKKERLERDQREKLMNEQVESLRRELEAVRRELEAVREESSERETVIKEQSKVIEAQTEKIRQHEATIQQLQERVKTLEDTNAQLERMSREALKAAPSLAPAPSPELIEAKRKTNQVPKIAPPEDIDPKDPAA